MNATSINISGKDCHVIRQSDDAVCLLVQLTNKPQEGLPADEMARMTMLTDVPFTLVTVTIDDWQHQLTPWAAPAVSGDGPFGSGAAETLHGIESLILPALTQRGIYLPDRMSCFLGGYSLAGLFALWSGYNSFSFDGIAAVSPSVWYPEWLSYAGGRAVRTKAMYLSLGDKEENTRNTVMAKVGDGIRRQYDLLRGQNVKTVMVWEKGGHFNQPGLRMANGFSWLMNSLCGNRHYGANCKTTGPE